jgi:hypothetical protein
VNSDNEKIIILDKTVEIPHLFIGLFSAIIMALFTGLLIKNIIIAIVMLIIAIIISLINWYFDTKVYFSKVEISDDTMIFRKGNGELLNKNLNDLMNVRKARGCNIFIFTDDEIKANVFIDKYIIEKMNCLKSGKNVIDLIGMFNW